MHTVRAQRYAGRLPLPGLPRLTRQSCHIIQIIVVVFPDVTCVVGSCTEAQQQRGNHLGGDGPSAATIIMPQPLALNVTSQHGTAAPLQHLEQQRQDPLEGNS